MFRIRARAYEIIDKFRAKGATSPEKALTVGELGLPRRFEYMMKGPVGFSGVFVEVEGRYYLSEERLKEMEENLASVAKGAFAHPLRHWMRYTASVPKGFLRLHVLKLLKEKAMSGSEIMEEIGRQTGGRWKPSPGSVYPLLAWLQEKGYIEEEPKERGDATKRYFLTGKGKEFLKEQSEFVEKIQQRLESSVSLLFVGFEPEKQRQLQKPVGRLIRAFLDFRRILTRDLSDKNLKDVTEFLEATAERFEEMTEKLQTEKGSRS
jgi:DNA-binding PadR family transcriptional regulator